MQQKIDEARMLSPMMKHVAVKVVVTTGTPKSAGRQNKRPIHFTIHRTLTLTLTLTLTVQRIRCRIKYYLLNNQRK